MSRVSDEELEGRTEGNWSVVSMSTKTLTGMACELRAARRALGRVRTVYLFLIGEQSAIVGEALAAYDATEDGEQIMPETDSVSAVAQEARRLSQNRFTFLRARAEKADAERDEALAKLKEQREWSDQYRDCMWAEHERADEALAQVAVLVEPLKEARREAEYHPKCGGCQARRKFIGSILSNLPAAAKEMLALVHAATGIKRFIGSPRQKLEALETENATLREQVQQTDALIMAVGNKYPGETRFETALRYIQQAQESAGEAQAALSNQKPTDAGSESI